MLLFGNMSDSVFILLAVLTHAAAGLVGYLIGRFIPGLLRMLPVAVILYIGYLLCADRSHIFIPFYRPLAILYTLGIPIGLLHRATVRKAPFWRQFHADWISLVAGLFLLSTVFVPPTA